MADNLVQQLSALIDKANRGKPNGPQVKALRQFIDSHPEMAKEHNVVAYSVRRGLMLKISAEPGNFELFEREYEKNRDELGWKDASPIERLMIERVMLCWMRLLWCEHYDAGFMQGGVSMRESEYADKQLARAHSRYVRALESLARLRLLTQALRYAEAKADLAEAKASEVSIRRSQRAVALLKAVNS
jgi:hypothetical protein